MYAERAYFNHEPVLHCAAFDEYHRLLHIERKHAHILREKREKSR